MEISGIPIVLRTEVGGVDADTFRELASVAEQTVEDILREALHPYPEHLLIATKIGQVQPRPGEWVPVGHPAFLRHQCEMSLRRLGVERIELHYLHRVDPTTQPPRPTRHR